MKGFKCKTVTDFEKNGVQYDDTKIDEIFNTLNSKGNLLYKFVLLYRDMIFEKKDYGTGDFINMVEVHTLTAIVDRPGITVTQLSAMWNRTKGAVSQIIAKLEEKGYLERRSDKKDAKVVHFYATKTGKELSQQHKIYDSIDITMTTRELLKECSAEEIDAFYKVIRVYLKMLEAK